VGHTPCDFTPGSRTLRREQLGKIFNHENNAPSGIHRTTQCGRRHCDRQRATAVCVAFELCLLGRMTRAARASQQTIDDEPIFVRDERA
jgi:hypothetical protein